MEKEKIEAVDKDFRENKLKRLRTSLAMRKLQGRQKKRNLRNSFKTTIPLLLALAAAFFFAGKTMLRHEPVPASTANSVQTAGNESNVPLGRTEPVGTVAETGKPVGSPSGAPLAEVPNTGMPPFAFEDEKEVAPLEKESTASFEVEKKVPLENPASMPAYPVGDQSGEMSESAENGVTESREPESAGDGVTEYREPEGDEPEPSYDNSHSSRGARIARSMVCSGVENRECVVPLSRFSLEQGQNPHFWMEVHSDSVPFVLKHIYYREGRKYLEVPLAIEYRRTRTWSRIYLQDSGQVGSWRVEIEAEDGTVLGRADFDVSTEER